MTRWTCEDIANAVREAWHKSWSGNGKHDEYNQTTRTCSTCKGRGYTRNTASTVVRSHGSLRTTERGSGCPACHGTGKVCKV